MTSKQLDDIQKLLIKYSIKELKQPMINFKLLRRTLKIIELVDTKRREKWNDEKFGPYEVMADNYFTNDDIPF